MESQFQAVGVQLRGATIVIDIRNLRQMLVNWNIYHIHIYMKRSQNWYTDPDQIFRQHETEKKRHETEKKRHEPEKKRQYASLVLEVEQARSKPLVFRTTGGMAVERHLYHSSWWVSCNKKGRKLRDYGSGQSVMDQGKVSFALLRSALFCLTGLWASRSVHLELSDID